MEVPIESSKDRYCDLSVPIPNDSLFSQSKDILQDKLEPPTLNILIDKKVYNIPRACLLNRSPVPAMDLKSNRSGLLMV